MSTYRRAFAPGGTFFFTVVTDQREPWFARPAHVDALRAAFARVRNGRPFEIDAIVILPDHLHTLWRLPEGDADFSGRWREIKKAASRRIDARVKNDRGERTVWQRRFWEHVVRDEEDWRRHLDYIHFNPVRHGLVSWPEAWPWSSFRRAVARGWYAPGWGAVEPSGIAGMDCE